jgi:hypothetical protein
MYSTPLYDSSFSAYYRVDYYNNHQTHQCAAVEHHLKHELMENESGRKGFLAKINLAVTRFSRGDCQVSD